MKSEDLIKALNVIRNSIEEMDSYNHSLSHDWESKVNRTEWFCAVIDTEIAHLIEAIETGGGYCI